MFQDSYRGRALPCWLTIRWCCFEATLEPFRCNYVLLCEDKCKWSFLLSYFWPFIYPGILQKIFDVIVPRDWVGSRTPIINGHILSSTICSTSSIWQKFSNVGLSCTWKVNLIQNTIFAGFSFIHLCKPGWTWHAWNNSCGPSRYHAWQNSRWSWTEDTLFRVLKNHATGNSAFGLQVGIEMETKKIQLLCKGLRTTPF